MRQLKKIQVAESITAGGNAPRMISAVDVTGVASILRYVPGGIVSSEFAASCFHFLSVVRAFY